MIVYLCIETSIAWNEVKDGHVGISISVDDRPAKTIFGSVRNCSESAAVLYGLKNVLGYLRDYDHIVVDLSCAQVANAFINGWVTTWEANDFKNAKGLDIKNKDVWIDVICQLKGKQLEVRLNEFNSYRKWLKAECLGRK